MVHAEVVADLVVDGAVADFKDMAVVCVKASKAPDPSSAVLLWGDIHDVIIIGIIVTVSICS